MYPVFVLEDETSRVTGAVAMFTEEWALGVENKSKSPQALAFDAQPVWVGTIDSPGLVLFNEAITGWNDRNVTVDVQLPAAHYEIIAWLAVVPILRDNGMDPFVRPIALGVYGPDLVMALDAVAQVDRSPHALDPYRPWKILAWPVMAHMEPRWQDALRYNFHDDSQRGDNDRALSWLLQGEIQQDPSSIDALTKLQHNGLSLSNDLRKELLKQRGQVADPSADPLIDEARVARAMSGESPRRDEARQQIIDAVDVDSMIACAARARERGDETDEEFWWFEVATVPEGDELITRGVTGLCNNILLPQGRFEEAELYCRHLLVRPSPASREQAQGLLKQIESLRRETGVVRLENTGAWRNVDVTKPLQPGLSAQQGYDRAYAIIEARNSDGHMDAIASAPRDAFMPFITGWLIGVSESIERTGLERDIFAKVVCDWLTDRGCAQLAAAVTSAGVGPEGDQSAFFKRSPGLGSL